MSDTPATSTGAPTPPGRSVPSWRGPTSLALAILAWLCYIVLVIVYPHLIPTLCHDLPVIGHGGLFFLPFLGWVPAIIAGILAAAELERLRPRPDPSSQTSPSLGALTLAAPFLTDEARARAQALCRAQGPSSPGRNIAVVALILAVLAACPPEWFCLTLADSPTCETISEVRDSALRLLPWLGRLWLLGQTKP